MKFVIFIKYHESYQGKKASPAGYLPKNALFCAELLFVSPSGY